MTFSENTPTGGFPAASRHSATHCYPVGVFSQGVCDE